MSTTFPFVPGQIRDYMQDYSNDHFTCQEYVHVQCCNDCLGALACGNGCTVGDNCEMGDLWQDATCPGAAPEASVVVDPGQFNFTLVNPESFFAAMGDEYGIVQDWMKLDQIVVTATAGCASTGEVTDDCFTYWTNYPMSAADITVPNPKDGIALALDNFQILRDALSEAYNNSMLFLLPDDDAEAIESVFLLVLMSVQAVASMQKVVEKAEDIEDAEKKELILGFLMGVLLLVPGVGTATEAIGLATLGRIIAIAGGVGNAAFALYEIVEDP